jgi:hypothetical protein
MICIDDDGNKYFESPIIPRRFFDWRDTPLNKGHKVEGINYFDEAVLTDAALRVLFKSPTIRAALNLYEDLLYIPITAERLLSAGDYCSNEKCIRVDQGQSLEERITTIAHEYRHAIQDIEGVLLNKKRVSRRCTTLLSEADAVAFEITVAYELRNIVPKLWDDLKHFGARYGALCDTFEKTVEAYPDALQNGLAANAVLENYISISFIREADFNYYFESNTGFRRPISPSRAFGAVNSYHEALIGIPFYAPELSTEGPIVERHEYLDPNPEDTDRVIKRLRGLVIF